MKNTNKKLLVVTIVSIILAISCVIGTVAFLAMKTDTITNVFTSGNIQIQLTETSRTYKMVPGVTLPKDPTVTVEAGSEASYVFVRVVADAKAQAAITWAVDEYDEENNPTGKWIKLDDVANVWYCKVDEISDEGENVVIPVLKGNSVVVNNLSSNEIQTNDGATLAITAFAVQQAEMADEAEAWAAAAALES